MTQKEYLSYLFSALDDLNKSAQWLRRSYVKCEKLDVKPFYSEDECDLLENLTSRFARTTDILVQKVYRAIDKVEFEEQGTFIDVLNRAHKRGLIESVEEIRRLKELRNNIAHEYKMLDLAPLFHDVLSHSPRLFELISQANEYCQKFSEPTL